MDSVSELVVLLAEDGSRIGTADKATVHTAETPLHLAFSCHLSNDRDEILVTRRALGKATWPGVWTNSFCGHPGPDEDPVAAIMRRAERELGATVADVEVVLPGFRYRAVDASGVVENEVCTVYRARLVGELDPAPDEIAEYAWVTPADLAAAVEATPFAFSPWLAMQLEQWPTT
jgi:isopentenyl-diphosphate delta-isomerase